MDSIAASEDCESISVGVTFKGNAFNKVQVIAGVPVSSSNLITTVTRSNVFREIEEIQSKKSLSTIVVA